MAEMKNHNDRTTDEANDNRSLSSFVKAPHRETADIMLGEVLLDLRRTGAPDAVLCDALFSYLQTILQPPADPTSRTAVACYAQLRRYAWELERTIARIDAGYDDDRA